EGVAHERRRRKPSASAARERRIRSASATDAPPQATDDAAPRRSSGRAAAVRAQDLQGNRTLRRRDDVARVPRVRRVPSRIGRLLGRPAMIVERVKRRLHRDIVADPVAHGLVLNLYLNGEHYPHRVDDYFPLAAADDPALAER